MIVLGTEQIPDTTPITTGLGSFSVGLTGLETIGPLTMNGSAAGKITLNHICSRFDPMVRAARR